VFYNRAMAFDRDLNVAVVRALRIAGVPLSTGWEMLGATGVRGLRTCHEAGGFRRFDLTELSPEAAEVLAQNAARYASEGARSTRADARQGPSTPPYEYVDLDPYGTPLPFLSVALEATVDGGVLAVTATDQRVLAGVERGVAETRYGGRPVRGRLGSEGGLRLMIAAVARIADGDGRSIEPILAYVGDHHVRAYLRVRDRRDDPTAGRIGTIDPARWTGPPLGEGGPFGPLWLGRLTDPGVVQALQPDPGAEHPGPLRRWVERIQEESQVDVPFFYESNTLARALHLPAPPSTALLIERLRGLGHAAARSVVREGAFRTLAPYSTVAAVAEDAAQSQNDRVLA
jgi:tRNA (guanine26-N2/guanine27-N2)-dimethyltransferase